MKKKYFFTIINTIFACCAFMSCDPFIDDRRLIAEEITKKKVNEITQELSAYYKNDKYPIYSGCFFYQYFENILTIDPIYMYVEDHSINEYIKKGGDTTNIKSRIKLCIGNIDRTLFYESINGDDFRIGKIVYDTTPAGPAGAESSATKK